MPGYPCCCHEGGGECNCTGELPDEIAITFAGVTNWVVGCTEEECDEWNYTFILSRQEGAPPTSGPTAGCWYLWDGDLSCNGTVQILFAFIDTGGVGVFILADAVVYYFPLDEEETYPCAIDEDVPTVGVTVAQCNWTNATIHVTAIGGGFQADAFQEDAFVRVLPGFDWNAFQGDFIQ